MMRLAEKLTVQTFIKGFQTLKKEGESAFYTKLKARLRPAVDYHKWLKENGPSREELIRQQDATWETMPLFSVLVPLYHTPDRFLRDMIESVISLIIIGNFVCQMALGKTVGWKRL